MDFSKLKYDISQVPEDEYVIDHFPALADYAEFENCDEDALIRWVILFVDPESPFFSTYKSDFEQKAKSIYKYLKLNDEFLNGYINGNLQKNAESEKFRLSLESMIFKFFIIIDKDTYNVWFSKWSFVQEMNAFLRIQIDPSDKSYEQKFSQKQKISQALGSEQKELAAYEKQVFGDSKIKQIAVAESAKVTNWPEKLALKYEYTG